MGISHTLLEAVPATLTEIPVPRGRASSFTPAGGEAGYTVEIPEGREQDARNLIMHEWSFPGGEAWVMVSRALNDEQMNTLDESAATPKKAAQTSRAKIHSDLTESDTTVAGRPARRIESTWEDIETGTVYRNISVIVKKDQYACFLFFDDSSEQPSENTELFEEVLDSFELTGDPDNN
jgi:hypothetical protein